MIEMIALSILAVSLGVYLGGMMIVTWAFLSEGRPLSHIVYFPLVLAWPYYFVKRVRELRGK